MSEAMPSRSRTARRLTISLVALVGVLSLPAAAGAQGTSSITGVAFKDTNRDGVKQPDEEALAGKRIHLFDGADAYLKNTLTDTSGGYVLSGLPDGRYQVHYGTSDWWELWQDWAPSTTGSELPRVIVQLSGTATADFGFRPIVRSTDIGAPISTYTSSEGLTVKSYNDVIEAKKVYDALMAGSLRGGEMPRTTIRFDYRPSNVCDISAVSANGAWGNYQANCYIGYVNWLNLGDNGLFHEYGHAWSLYHAYIIQQDPSLSSYLEARGLAGDPRIGTSSKWSPMEMIAEDYRQLFGTAAAAAGAQDNGEIPRASEVPGLSEFLSGPFMQSALPPPLPPPTPKMHVGDLRAHAAKAGRGWMATTTVGVLGGSNEPVGGAAVTLHWSAGKGGTGQVSCTTAAGGSCSSAIQLTNKVDRATLTVASIAKDGFSYDSDANVTVSVSVTRPR
jgi:SdrD B-like domain